MADDESDYDAISYLIIDEIEAVVGDAKVAADVDLVAVREVIRATLLREGVEAGVIREVDANADMEVGSYVFSIDDRMSQGGKLIRASMPENSGPRKDRTPLGPCRKAEASAAPRQGVEGTDRGGLRRAPERYLLRGPLVRLTRAR